MELYRAYWDDEKDIGDIETLVNIAGAVGLDEENARDVLTSKTNASDVKQEAEAFRMTGVTGVPSMVAEIRFRFSP